MSEKYFKCRVCKELATETELLHRCHCGQLNPEEDRITKAEYNKEKGIVTLNQTLRKLEKHGK